MSDFGKVTAFPVGLPMPSHFIHEPKYLENIPRFKNMHSWHVLLPGSLEIRPEFSHQGQARYKNNDLEDSIPKKLGSSIAFNFFSIKEVSSYFMHPQLPCL